jgi:hypothetical protein
MAYKVPWVFTLFARLGLNFRELSSIYESLAAVIFNSAYKGWRYKSPSQDSRALRLKQSDGPFGRFV